MEKPIPLIICECAGFMVPRGSTLTAEGRELMEFYDEFNRRVNDHAVREFEGMKQSSVLFV